MMPEQDVEGFIQRKTLNRPVRISGKGLHSGETGNLRILPAQAGTGLVFRPNSGQVGDIPVSPFNVVETRNAVTLGNGNWQVGTVEHLLGALFTAGVTDAYLEIDAEEIPTMDGSARIFYEEIVAGGVRELDSEIAPIRISNPIWVVHEDKYIVALPHDGFRVTYSISYDHALLKGQSLNMELNRELCIEEILPARTFGFEKDAEYLRSNGLAQGATLENALIITDSGYLNESLRFEDECVRHKVLDLIGDLYLLGRPLKAHVIASRAGHSLDVALGKNIMTALFTDELRARRGGVRVPSQVGSGS